LFSRFCFSTLRCAAHSAPKTRVNVLAEGLRCVRDAEIVSASRAA
jgi:hypothetical protein